MAIEAGEAGAGRGGEQTGGPPGAWPVATTAELFARAVYPLRRPGTDPAVVAADAAAAAVTAADLTRALAPRDAAEELLVAQMVWTHARITALTRVVGRQTHPKWFALYSTELTRAGHLFRRQLQALDDHRRPRRRPRASFTTIRTTAHVAAHHLFAAPPPTGGVPDVAAHPQEPPPQAALQADPRRLHRPAAKRLGPPAMDP